MHICSQNSSEDLWVKLHNPDWELNLQAGTQTQSKHRLGLEPFFFLIELTHLVSEINKAQVLCVWSQKEFSKKQSDR